MPKLSIIIPIYNAEGFLVECLDSIVSQTLRDIEIICVDDGSKDNSLKILKDYASKDSRFKILIQLNQGAGVARNLGIQNSKSDYIHFMDADDILYERDVYERLFNKLEELNYPNLVRFKTVAFDAGNKDYIENAYYELKHFEQKGLLNTYLNIENNLKDSAFISVAPWAGIIKRSFVLQKDLKFNDLKCCNDRSFFRQSILLAQNIFISDICVVNHRVNNKASLIGLRDKNFNCMFKSTNLIVNFLEKNNFSNEVKKQVKMSELADIFYFYSKYKDKSKYFYKIHIDTIKFLKEFEIEELYPEIQKQFYYNEMIKLKKIKSLFWARVLYWAKKIFSITNENNGKHYSLCILGLKIKFKKK